MFLFIMICISDVFIKRSYVVYNLSIDLKPRISARKAFQCALFVPFNKVIYTIHI